MVYCQLMRELTMLAKKIKQLRLSRGWSLDELVAHIGGVVTKQAISKYELGLDQPSAPVLAKIASALTSGDTATATSALSSLQSTLKNSAPPPPPPPQDSDGDTDGSTSSEVYNSAGQLATFSAQA